MMKTLTALSLLSSPGALTGFRNITITQPGVDFAPDPLPLPGPSSQADEIIRQFTELSRSTEWKLVDKVPFEGDTFEPEGLARIGSDRYFVSAGEYTVPTEKYNATIGGTDRTAGAGFGHMIVFDGRGRRIADATVTEAGSDEVRVLFFRELPTFNMCLPTVLHRTPIADGSRSTTTAASTMTAPTSGRRWASTGPTPRRRWCASTPARSRPSRCCAWATTWARPSTTCRRATS